MSMFYKELSAFNSIFMKGVIFRYDIDNSGAIDKKEMVGVMKAIYAMVDGNVSGAVRGGTEEKASKHAEKLFVLIDTDGDGNLTEKEFLRVGNKGLGFLKTTSIAGMHAG